MVILLANGHYNDSLADRESERGMAFLRSGGDNRDTWYKMVSHSAGKRTEM
jgi:hypothetical protein